MKKYGIPAVGLAIIAILALGSWRMTLAAGAVPQAPAKTAAASADGATPAATSASTMAVAEPVDLAQLPPPVYLGITPAPSKNGPFGIAQAMPISVLNGAAAATIRWFDTQDQALAAIHSSAPNSIILGTLWENAPPSGRSLTIYGADCNNLGVPNLGSSAFDNITSALDNSCGSATLYFNTNYGGPQQTYGNGRTSNVGSGMNDQASSVFFKP
ncbi:MAG: hypothetical protein M3Z04_10275 [Chloroflexota bacterium]|nr:hypothetical protein [Chloroflexota bacterium]